MTVEELRSTGNRVFVTHIRNYWGQNGNHVVRYNGPKTIVEFQPEFLTSKELKNLKERGNYISNSISPMGGATVVEILTPNGETFIGCSICSRKDNFNRKMGLAQAIQRAMSEMESSYRE